MTIKRIIQKFGNVTFKKIYILLFRRLHVFKYKLLSTCNKITGKPTYHTAVLINGLGSVEFGQNIHLGTSASPSFFSSYIYIEPRTLTSRIVIGDNVYINNNACLISEGEGIIIANDVLIGQNFNAYDSDFHELDPLKRHSGKHKTKQICIRKNVFIGSNVTILKGVEIGENTVIASGSIVTKSIESNVIAGGNPCKVLKLL